MPIDINNIRADRGGDPEKWREYCRKRNKPAELVDRVVDLDAVRDIWVWEGGKRRADPRRNVALDDGGPVRVFAARTRMRWTQSIAGYAGSRGNAG